MEVETVDTPLRPASRDTSPTGVGEERDDGPAVDWTEHLGLAKLAARTYFWQWKDSHYFDEDDVLQACTVKLAQCAASYNPDKINPETGKPYRFNTYYMMAVKSGVQWMLRQSLLGVKVNNTPFVLERVSLDARGRRSGGEDDGAALIDRTQERRGSGDDRAVREGYAAAVDALMAVADREFEDPRWRHIIRRVFIDGWTHTKTGHEMGVTKQRVHQICTKIRVRLRELRRDGALPEALGDWLDAVDGVDSARVSGNPGRTW